MPDTDKSVSALATNGHVLDKSKTNPLEFSDLRHVRWWQVQTRIVRIWHVLDMS